MLYDIDSQEQEDYTASLRNNNFENDLDTPITNTKILRI